MAKVKNSEEAKPRRRRKEDFELDPATRDLVNNIGKYVVLGMARGPTIRGVLTDFDPRYRKIKVKQGNVETWVLLSYVISFSVVTGEEAKAEEG